MLTLILGLTIGYFVRKYTVFEMLDDGSTASAEINFGQLIKDVTWLFGIIGFCYTWTIATARNTRTYCDTVLFPWLSERGISIQLPTIVLPAMPTDTESELEDLLEVQA
ncbi:MAG: hypothetical protein MUC48_25720 [Leptolyngbya sp. Prado105]|jgi:hypothetical protein|nr:hypothetical protein [Leptolyngbya sp. Prado105]